jgi:hypothetical protein
MKVQPLPWISFVFIFPRALLYQFSPSLFSHYCKDIYLIIHSGILICCNISHLKWFSLYPISPTSFYHFSAPLDSKVFQTSGLPSKSLFFLSWHCLMTLFCQAFVLITLPIFFPIKVRMTSPLLHPMIYSVVGGFRQRLRGHETFGKQVY